MIVNSPPEFNYSRGLTPAASTDPTADKETKASGTEEWVLRGAGSDEKTKKLARSLNDHAWDLSDSGKSKEALMFARLADRISPENGNILDTLAEMLYAEKEYSEALEFKEKAAGLDAKFKKDIKKFKAAAKP